MSSETLSPAGTSIDPGRRDGLAGLAILLALLMPSGVALAQLQPEPLVRQDLPGTAGAHWVWVNDVVFHHMVDGKAFLIDGDSGNMLGMLSTGFGFGSVLIPGDRSVIISPETHFSRGTRGTRTDVVMLYDARTLDPIDEIEIPAKRSSNIPMRATAALTDDDRFLLIYNFTPAQSVTVVDLPARKFVGEIDTPGCALVYPTGPRSFFSLCGDGTALAVRLDDAGGVSARERTSRLFDAEQDPVTEKAVRDGNTWLFASFAGDIVAVETVEGRTQTAARWSLTTADEREQGWKPGGLQHLALHATDRRLYSLMHQGGPDTHKEPGSEIWVYDVASRERRQRIALEEPLTSIAVTGDERPLLFGTFIVAPQLRVFDGRTGAALRSIGEVGFTPTVLVTY
jgi:methylamine dehydrogenase heavy chain